MPRLHLLTLLVIDDDPIDRLVYRRYLAGHAAVIEELPNRAHAVAACKRTTFDCVILAVGRGDQAAVDMIGHLRAAGETTPILGIADEDDAPALIAAGATDVLGKAELSPQRLVRRLRLVIRCGQTERELERARIGQATQRALLRAVLRHVPTGVAVVDAASGRWVHINRPAAALLSSAETSLAEARHDIVGTAARQAMDDALRTGKMVVADHVTSHLGRPYRLTATPINDEVGRIVAGVLLVNESTDPLVPSTDQLVPWGAAAPRRR